MKRAVTCWVGHQQRRLVECIHSVKKVHASTAADYYNYRVLLLRIRKYKKEKKKKKELVRLLLFCVFKNDVTV